MVESIDSWRRLIPRSNLPTMTRLLLHVLAMHAEEAGEISSECSPTIEILARHTSLSRRSVFRHLKIAERAGWIERHKQGAKGSRWAANRYQLRRPDGGG